MLDWENNYEEFNHYEVKENIIKRIQKKDEIKDKAIFHINKNVYKNNILTLLYNSGIFQNKMRGFFYRYNINNNHNIMDDCIQTIFLEFSKKTNDYIISRYEKDENILIGLGVRIISWQIFGKSKQYVKKASLIEKTYEFSNLKCNQKNNDDYDYLDNLTIEEDEFEIEIEKKEENEINIYNNINRIVRKYKSILSGKSIQTFETFMENWHENKNKKKCFDSIFFNKKTNKIDVLNFVKEVSEINKSDEEIMKNKREVYNELKNIKEILFLFVKNKNVKHIQTDLIENMKKIKKCWKLINPASNPTMLGSCASCLNDALLIMSSIQERLEREFYVEDNQHDLIDLTFENPVISDVNKEELFPENAKVEAKKRYTAKKSNKNIKK